MNAEADLTAQLAGARALNSQLLDYEGAYRKTIADRLGVTYETASDAAALCDALAPRLAIEADAVKAAANAASVLPDALMLDDDGNLPTPARVIRILADALRAARRDTTRANEDLDAAHAEADGLRDAVVRAQGDLRTADRARDSWREATSTTAKALAIAASALADVAAIR